MKVKRSKVKRSKVKRSKVKRSKVKRSKVKRSKVKNNRKLTKKKGRGTSINSLIKLLILITIVIIHYFTLNINAVVSTPKSITDTTTTTPIKSITNEIKSITNEIKSIITTNKPLLLTEPFKTKLDKIKILLNIPVPFKDDIIIEIIKRFLLKHNIIQGINKNTLKEILENIILIIKKKLLIYKVTYDIDILAELIIDIVNDTIVYLQLNHSKLTLGDPRITLLINNYETIVTAYQTLVPIHNRRLIKTFIKKILSLCYSTDSTNINQLIQVFKLDIYS